MRLFIKYLKQNLKSISFYLLFTIVFLVIFALYEYPLYPVIYAFIICTFFGCVFILSDYIRFYRFHRELEKMLQQIQVSMDELPLPRNQIELDYSKIIETIYEDKISLITQKDKQYENMIDYYTLWAHQIKTPIAALRLLLSDTQNIECEEELFKIEQYVDMVLTYLKFDHYGSDLKIKKIDVDTCIKKSIRKYAKLFIRKKLKLNYDSKSIFVLSDEKWLCFIIEQILSNAIKYTPSGKIDIYVEDEVLVIQDSGIGIQSEDIPLVFEKGFIGFNGRVDFKSTGIGLYLVKKICRKLGHKIWIESEVGEYTKVFVDLKRYSLEVE